MSDEHDASVPEWHDSLPPVADVHDISDDEHESGSSEMRDSTPDHNSSEMQPPPPPTTDQEMSSYLPAPVTLSGPSTSMIAMPVPSAPEVLPPRLREMQPPPPPTAEQQKRLSKLVELIAAKEKRWTLEKHDIALLLMYKDDPQLVAVPRRPEADKYLASGPCVFFVDRSMPADGKKRKSEASPQAGGSSNDEMWIKGTSTSAAGGSLDKKLPPNAPYSAVFRKSGGFTPEAKMLYGPRCIGHYCLGYTEGHPNFDPEDLTRPLLRVGRKKEEFQPCATWLVHCMPTEHDSDDAKTSGAPDKPDTTSGSPMAAGSVAPLDHPGDLRVGGSATIASDLTVGGDLRVGGSATIASNLTVGGTLHHEDALVSGRGDHAEYLRKYDEEEELNGGDVVALVGDDDGVQKASHRARGSTTAVWMVVTTEPQMLGNAPEPGQERLWVPLVFSGQVSVPPRTSYLSGY